MINCEMRYYNYYTFGTENEYGQQTPSTEVVGQVKMAIFTTSQSIQDNINYKQANYVGLTNDTINDSFVIKYGEEKLKVLYIVPKGRLKQVFLIKI
jgi:hypothetical protein